MKSLRLALLTVIPLLFALSAWAQPGVQFTLATSFLLEGPSAGSDAIFISASGLSGTEGWTVNVSDTWIALVANDSNSPTGIGFSNGTNLLRFNFTANAGASRTATIYIGGAASASLTVTQAGGSFVPAGTMTLIPAGLNGPLFGPSGIAVDNQGNLYIADTASHSIIEWIASTQQVNPLTPLSMAPVDIKLDAAGNQYLLEIDPNTKNAYIFEVPNGNGQPVQLWTSTSVHPVAVCVDAAGQNVYVADGANSTSCVIEPLGNTYVTDAGDLAIGANPLAPQGGGFITNLVIDGVPVIPGQRTLPFGLSVDNGDHIYFTDTAGQILRELDLYGQPKTTVLATGLLDAYYSAVDASRNVYLSGTLYRTIQEVPHAYMSPAAFAETAAAGSDSIQVLPISQSLTGVYAAVSSDPWWLTVQTAANGVVQFSFTANTGAQRSATITVLGLPITVTQWATQVAGTMNITAGNNQNAAAWGQPFATNLQVQVFNSYQNPVPGVQVYFVCQGASFGAPYYTSYTATTDANGFAAAPPLSAALTGAITVTATVAGSGISQTFNLTAVGDGIAAAAGSGQGALVNQSFPTNLKVLVYDGNGNPLSGVSVQFSVPASGASGTFSGGGNSVTVQTGADGSATAPALTANGIAGNFTATAYAAGVTSGTSTANFNLTNYTAVYKLAGDGQTTATNTAFATNLTVLVVDQNANPVPGAIVTLLVVPGAGGASALFTPSGGTAVGEWIAGTGSIGTLTAPVLTANGTAGTFTVMASVQGLPSQAFSLANAVGAFNYGGGQSGATTRALPQPFVVQASAGATAGTMVFTVVPNTSNGAGGSFNGANSVTVNLDAQRYGTSPQLTANNTPGDFTVTAYDGVTTSVSSVSTVECLNPGNTQVIVTDTSDFNPAYPFGGFGLTAVDTGNLRYAVNNACAGSTIDLTQLTGTITLFTRLRIDDSLTIVGPGANLLAIDGGKNTRLFFIGGGTVAIDSVTLQNGLGQGGSSSQGGAAAGMGGAIFMSGGTVTLSGVTFSGHQALGGNGTGSTPSTNGGGGFGGNPSQSNQGVPGAGGGDLFGLGGLTAGASGGPGGGGAGSVCTAGAIAGNGGFGGGGGMSCAPSNGVGGNGGFGGGGAAGFAPSILADAPGTGGFGGGTGFLGNNSTNWAGGGGASFGGAIFEYAGTLILNNDQFLNNSAVGGVAQVINGTGAAINNGQGKGGALFIYYGATAIDNGSTFGVGSGAANIAPDAGAPAIGNSAAPYANGATCPGQDTVDVCGMLLQPPAVSLTGPATAVYGSQFSVIPVSNSGATPAVVVTGGPCQMSGSNITMTAGTGSCQLQATWLATTVYSSATATLSVPAVPIAVTPSVTAASKTFDGTTAATITGCSVSNVLPADAGNVTCTAASAIFASAGADVNILVIASGITLGGPAAANYVLASTVAGATANIAFSPTPTACIAAPAGITGWWKADGNVNDATGLYNATVGGNAAFAPGKVGQAFSFDGSQSPYVALPAGAFPTEPSASPFTFETWFQTSGSAGGVILGSQSGTPYAGVPGGWTPAIYVGTDGLLYAQMFWSTNGFQTVASRNVPVNDGQWHHVAVTYDGSTEIVYLDGASIGTISPLTQANNGTPLYYQLGTGYTGNGWPAVNGVWFTFTGLIDEATVYSRALSAAEIVSVAEADSYGKCNAGASLSPSTLSFTNVAQGQTAIQPSVLFNAGNAPLQISAVATDSGDTNFSVLTGGPGDCAVGTPIAPNASCNVRVQFAPQAAGALTGVVTVTDNSLYLGGVQTIALSGSGLLAQTIAFGAISAQTLHTTLPLSASATSGLAVSFTSSTPSTCTVSNTTASLQAAGTCTIVAAQAGNSTYAPAMSVTQSFSVNRIAQTITFASLPNQPLGTAPFTVTATASSGLTVNFASATPSTCTVSGNTVTLIAVARCTLQASQPGGSKYAPAQPVVQGFQVTKEAQTITFATLPNRTIGTPPFTISATASSGLPVSFASATLSTCTISGNTVTLVAVGQCTIRASQAGNTTYQAAPPVTRSFQTKP